MRILVLSFYFEPDLSAGSFRNTALVNALGKQVPTGSEIDVITTLPNRYSVYSASASEFEKRGSISIRRVNLPTHKGGMLDQSKSFIFFALAVKNAVKGKQYDLVYASSSRLMTAFLGALISKKIKVPLYLDIRDIFVDTIKDVLPRKLVWLMKPLFSIIEKFTISRAKHVNLVSAGFEDYFVSRYKKSSLSFFTNGIDDEFLRAPIISKPCIENSDSIINILYAGNIGEGQGLHHIIPQVAQKLSGKVKFKVIGAGGRLTLLSSELTNSGVENVEIFPPMNRNELIHEYQNADVLFLHLNDYDAFKKVLPSKLFEYGAVGKPILAGVAGYAAKFVNENIDNAEVFSPCSIEGAIDGLFKLNMGTKLRGNFVKQYARENIMKEMAANIIHTCKVETK